MTRSLLSSMQPTLVRLICTVAAFALMAATGHAQFSQVVAEDDFDSYADTSFVVFTDGTSISLVPDGSGGNAVQFSYTTVGGFLARGFDWDPIVQPGAGGANTSPNRADYQLSFDLTINSDYSPANGFEVWVKDQVGQGDPEGDPSASLYGVGLGGFTTGVPQTVTINLGSPSLDDPFGYTMGVGFTPTVDQIRMRFNGLDFNSPAATQFTFTVDNFSLRTIPEPTTVALLLGGVALLHGARQRRMRCGLAVDKTMGAQRRFPS